MHDLTNPIAQGIARITCEIRGGHMFVIHDQMSLKQCYDCQEVRELNYDSYKVLA